ncbi:MAG: HD domain-containing phosphohydrolase [Caldisericaceae bacterium]
MNMVIVLEYLLYLPAFLAALIASYQAYLRKGKYIDLFYVSLLSLPFIAIIATTKMLFILKYGLTAQSFLSGNLPYLVLVGFAFAFSARSLIPSKALNLSKYLVAGIALLIALAIFTRDLYQAVDLISYGLIGAVIMNVGSLFYFSSKRKDFFSVAAVVLSQVSISADILLKVLYYYKLLPLFPTIWVSLLLRVIGSLLVVYLAVLFGRSAQHSEIPIEVKTARMHTMWRSSMIVFVTSLVIVMIMFSAFTRINSYASLSEDSAKVELSTQLNNLHSQFDSLLNDSFTHLNFLAELGVMEQPDSAKAHEQVISFYNAHKSIFSSITLMNTKGIIVYTYPFLTAIGSDISSQPHVKEVLSKKQITLSDPIMAIQGFPALIIHIPAFQGKEFIGTVVGLIDARSIRSFLNVNIYGNYDFIIAEDGIVLSTNVDNSFIMKSLSDIIKQFGEKNYFSQSLDCTNHERKFEIVLLQSKTAFLANTNSFATNQWGFASLLILLLLVVLYIAAESLRREDYELVSSVQSALARESEEHSKVISTERKIAELSQFIFTTSVDASRESFFEALLSTAVKIMPQVEKASAWLNHNGIVSPVASFGYDFEALKQLKTDLSSEEHRWSENRIYVVEDIGKDVFESAPNEVINQLGIRGISQTLVAPIYIGNRYEGSIFFDNFENSNVFTDEDISLAKIVMRTASFFVSEKEIIEELQSAANDILNLSLRLEKLIEFQSEISPVLDRKLFFNKLLSLSLTLIPHAQKGSVYLAEGSIFKPICWEGYSDEAMQKLEIPLEQELKTLKGGDACVVRSIGVKDFATEDERKIAELTGVAEIKATIHSPIFINDEYLGGVFLDSLKDVDAFDENDLKIARAISNTSALFLRSQMLLIEKRSTDVANKIVVQSVSLLAEPGTLEKAVSNIFGAVQKPLHIELRGVLFSLELLGKRFVIKASAKSSSSEYVEEVELCDFDKPAVFSKGQARTCKLLKGVTDYEQALIVPVSSKDYAVYLFGGGKLDTEEEKVLIEITKDIIPLVENRELLREMQQGYVETLVSLSQAIESKDPYTSEHSEGVTVYSYLIARKLNLPFKEMRTLLYAAILHDVGKIGIPDAILQKPGKLTDEEYNIVKMHPELGERIVGTVSFLKESSQVLLHHHERYDGKGYPSQLSGEEIPFLSRILSVADAFDAMTTARPYRKAFSFDEAVKELLKQKGLQFDPKIVDAFLSIPREEIESVFANKPVIQIFNEVLLGEG